MKLSTPRFRTHVTTTTVRCVAPRFTSWAIPAHMRTVVFIQTNSTNRKRNPFLPPKRSWTRKYAPGGGGHFENFLTGVCRWGFQNHTLAYGQLRPETDPCLRKCAKTGPCLRRSGTKSRDFDRNVAESPDFWPDFSNFSPKSGENRRNSAQNGYLRGPFSPQFPKVYPCLRRFAKNIPLAPWLRRLRLKKSPLPAAHPH